MTVFKWHSFNIQLHVLLTIDYFPFSVIFLHTFLKLPKYYIIPSLTSNLFASLTSFCVYLFSIKATSIHINIYNYISNYLNKLLFVKNLNLVID